MIAAEQNYFIATNIERAERAIDALMRYGIAVATVTIGIYTQPIIKVHYSEGCAQLKGHGYSQTPDSLRGVLLTRASLEQSLIVWEEPYNPAPTLAAQAAVH